MAPAASQKERPRWLTADPALSPSNGLGGLPASGLDGPASRRSAAPSVRTIRVAMQSLGTRDVAQVAAQVRLGQPLPCYRRRPDGTGPSYAASRATRHV